MLTATSSVKDMASAENGDGSALLISAQRDDTNQRFLMQSKISKPTRIFFGLQRSSGRCAHSQHDIHAISTLR